MSVANCGIDPTVLGPSDLMKVIYLDLFVP